MEKIVNLWGEELSVEDTPLQNKELLKKTTKKVLKTVSVQQAKKKISLEEKKIIAEEDVNRVLGKWKSSTATLKTFKDFVDYIDACISNKVMSIDTETNNTLNTFDCKLMGLCLYTPGQKRAYIPVNHVDDKGNKLNWQVTEEQISGQLKRCENAFKIFHNAPFDIEVLLTTCGIRLKADWDTQIGAQMLNENEPKRLKEQYKIHVDAEQESYDIEHLFKGLPYAIFDPDLFALYSATDAYDTYKLYEYQKKELEKPVNKEVYELFKTVEMPTVDVVVDMEMNGVEVDLEYAKKLSVFYHKKSDEVQERIDKELERLKPTIDSWRMTSEANTPTIGKTGKEGKSKNQKLSDPPLLSSPEQVSILLYDILKAPVVDKKSPRSASAEVLGELASKIPLCKLIDEKRGYDKLLSSFIDTMPEVTQKDGRVHARFNSCGTKTGRFSSEKPNL